MGYILLLEDNVSVGKTIARVLRGSRVVWVQRGEDALDQLEADDNAAVVLVDLQLEDSMMQGTDLIEMIRDRWPPLLERTFLMTGHPHADVSHLVPDGVGYIRKPVSVGALRAIVQPFSPDPA